jgi:dTDP-4-amino-4,6-dideoxygalactose transaminase
VAVPLLDLHAQYDAVGAEISAAVGKVLESQHFILGPEVEAFEQEIADYCGTAHAIGVSSGTDALLVALMALDVGPGDEVITTPFTFFATAGAVARLGARPVFVDIDPVSYNIDPEQIAKAITPRTRAILPVHLYGQPAAMTEIMEIAGEASLPVIEDAAQAIGAELGGQRAGSLGDIGCFSFFPSKNLGGVGDGGMVTTKHSHVADRVRLLRNHGFAPKYYNKEVGGNFRLDAIQAAVLRVKLKYLDGCTEGRQRNASRYRRLFTDSGVTLDAVALRKPATEDAARGVFLPVEAPGVRHIYNQFVVRTAHRDAVATALKRHDIGHELYYPVPLHLQECFSYLGYREGDLENSERAALETVALPIYPELSLDQQEAVVAAATEGIALGLDYA